MRYNIDGYFNKPTVVKLKAIIENETYLDFHFDYANAGANILDYVNGFSKEHYDEVEFV